MSNKKNEWSPNETQRATLLALQKESGANQAEFCAEFGSSCIGTPSKLSQILDALEAGKTSYFNKIEDPEALMRELAEFMDELPELQQRRMMSEDVKILPLSHFAATAIAARECRDKKSPERAIQYIAPTGGSKSFLFQHLAKKLKNDFSMGFVNCRDSWKPATRDLRQRAKLTVLKDICAGLKIRLGEPLNQFRYDMSTDIEDALVDQLRRKSTLVFIEEGRFLSTYPLNLFIDLLNRTKMVLVLTCTPLANVAWHRYYPDEANQIDRRTHAVVRVSVISPADAGLFFGEDQFADRASALKLIADSASNFGHYSLVARLQKFLQRDTAATQDRVESAITKVSRELNRNLKFATRN
jgi:hypothetical protein